MELLTSVLVGSLPGQTHQAKLAAAHRYIFDKLEDEVEKLAEITESARDALRAGMDIDEAIERAMSLGCQIKKRDRRFVLTHPSTPHQFTFYRDRYAGHALIKWLRKVESWVNRQYKPQPVIQPAAPPPAAPEPEPELVVIPDVCAPTVMPQLTIWTIYSPMTTDQRGYYVVRAHDITQGNAAPVAREAFTLHLKLEEARAKGIPPGLTCLPRSEADDPVIIESWI